MVLSGDLGYIQEWTDDGCADIFMENPGLLLVHNRRMCAQTLAEQKGGIDYMDSDEWYQVLSFLHWLHRQNPYDK